LGLLERIAAEAQNAGRVGSLIEILALQALTWEALGETDSAMVSLERALALAAPEGYVRLFVDEGAPMADLLRCAAAQALELDYVRPLLTAFGETTGPVSRMPEGLVEPLTPRELEVLRLLGAGLSNPEIAEHLSIAPSTVKTHTLRIYGKLQVHSRTQAVTRARECHLL
jgi:LuxR family maltose regulon positive regulatory protein